MGDYIRVSGSGSARRPRHLSSQIDGRELLYCLLQRSQTSRDYEPVNVERVFGSLLELENATITKKVFFCYFYSNILILLLFILLSHECSQRKRKLFYLNYARPLYTKIVHYFMSSICDKKINLAPNKICDCVIECKNIYLNVEDSFFMMFNLLY